MILKLRLNHVSIVEEAKLNNAIVGKKLPERHLDVLTKLNRYGNYTKNGTVH